MSTTKVNAIEEVAKQLGDCLTPDSAKLVANLKAHRTLQDRIDLLAEKNAESDISAQEREELEGYTAAAAFLSIIQAEARRIVRSSANQ